MKKLFAFILGGAFTASFAFADVSIGISGRGAARVFDFSGYNNDYDNEAAKTAGVFGKDGSHSSPATVFGEFLNDFNFSASTEDGMFGMNLDLEYTVDSEGGFGNVSLPDQAKVWWMPTDWFLGQIGMVEVDDLRGTIGDWGVGRRDIGSLDEDAIFDRFYPQAGLALSFYPLEGLFIGATFDAFGPVIYDNNGAISDDSAVWAENFYKGINVGFGYTIDEKFQIKAAYFGAKDPRDGSKDELKDDDFNGKLELGFDWNINESNLLEVGVKIPLWSDNDSRRDSVKAAILNEEFDFSETCLFQAVAGLAGNNDNYTYKAHAFYVNSPMVNKDNDLVYYPTFGVDAGLEYALDTFTLGATARYSGGFCNDSPIDKNIAVNTFGAEVYVKKDVAADCFVFAGIADTLTVTDVEDTVKKTENRFYIPIGIEYAF